MKSVHARVHREGAWEVREARGFVQVAPHWSEQGRGASSRNVHLRARVDSFRFNKLTDCAR